MNKKDYEGYELIKAISDKEIKDKTKIEVHSLKVLDNTIAVIEYKNKRLEWGTGEFDTSYLFDKDYYFRILEDNTEEIEELELIGTNFMDMDKNQLKDEINKNRISINKLRQEVFELRKDKNND